MMSWRIIAGAAAIAVTGCTHDEHGKSIGAPVPSGMAVTITADDAGKKIAVPIGGRFAVALAGVPTAGYVWAPSTMPAFTALSGTGGGPTHEAQTTPGFAGGNHWEVFVFDVKSAGRGALVFEQRRPWESPDPAVGRFAVDIEAK